MLTLTPPPHNWTHLGIIDKDAQSLSKRPVLKHDDGGDTEGHTQHHDEQIPNGKIGDEEVGDGVHLLTGGDCVEDEGVAEKRQHEDTSIHLIYNGHVGGEVRRCACP